MRRWLVARSLESKLRGELQGQANSLGGTQEELEMLKKTSARWTSGCCQL